MKNGARQPYTQNVCVCVFFFLFFFLLLLFFCFQPLLTLFDIYYDINPTNQGRKKSFQHAATNTLKSNSVKTCLVLNALVKTNSYQ